MKMKTPLFALVLLLTMIGSSVPAFAATNTEPPKEKKAELTEEQKARIETLTKRVEAIKAMNRSKMSRVERAELRKELRDINKEAKAIRGQGIYISLGALLVIVLLLILLL